MPAIKQQTSEHLLRGRSPWPVTSSRGRSSEHEQRSSSEQNAALTRSSKRKKRSDLSPSSKATHSIIERERREAMNEKFSELAAQVPELVEAIAAGKRPTKGEIVKASIARHQAQDRHIKEMQLELQALRASNELQGITVQQGLAASMPTISVDLSQQQQHQNCSSPYEIQPSRPVLQNTEEGSIWLGQLLGKASDQLDRSPIFQPTLVSSDLMPIISPFKQSCLISGWDFPGFQKQHFDSNGVGSKILVTSGLLDHLSRDDTSSLTTFPSPTFTSSDTESSFSSDPLDSATDDTAFLSADLNDNMSFEPFVLSDDTVEETPLSALLYLPPADVKELHHSSSGSLSHIKDKRPVLRQFNTSSKEERTTIEGSSVSSTLLPIL